MSKSINYQPHIDGLRAIAVLSVLVFHLDKSWLPGGFVGVDIFFVISGYLITSILTRDRPKAFFIEALLHEKNKTDFTGVLYCCRQLPCHRHYNSCPSELIKVAESLLAVSYSCLTTTST